MFWRSVSALPVMDVAGAFVSLLAGMSVGVAVLGPIGGESGIGGLRYPLGRPDPLVGRGPRLGLGLGGDVQIGLRVEARADGAGRSVDESAAARCSGDRCRPCR